MRTTFKDTFYKSYPYAVCLIAGLLFFYEFIQTNILSSLNIALIQQFKLNSIDVSLLASAYFYSSTMFIMGAGLLLDKYSVKRLIVIAMLFCVTGTLCLSLSKSYRWALASRFISGIGNSFSLIACVKLSSRWFPSSRITLVTGLIVAIAMMGGATAQLPFSLIISKFGWRLSLIFDVILGLFIIFLIIYFVKDWPSNIKSNLYSDERKQNNSIALPSSWRISLKTVLNNRQNWLASIYTSLLNLPIFVLAALWGSLYLQNVYGFSHHVSTKIVSFIYFGTMLGAPFIGFVSDKINKKRILMIIGSFLSICILILVDYANKPSEFYLEMLFFLLGFFSSSQIISYSLVNELNSKNMTATSVSLVSLFAVLGGLLGQPIFGWIINLNYSSILRMQYDYAEHYKKGILFLLLCSIISLICSILIKDKKIVNCNK